MDVYVLTAAGGNPTAIGVIEKPQKRAWYESAGKRIIAELPDGEVEQVGFLDPINKHFEMAGGEFCGNGARAAGQLLSDHTDVGDTVSFTCSGYEGKVIVQRSEQNGLAIVCGVFPNLSLTQQTNWLPGVGLVAVVDLGGIVHVVVGGALPLDYEGQQQTIIKALALEAREAVGVCWVGVGKQSDSVAMNPVVWVRSINTCFYESACGSGSIAVAAAAGIPDVVQPTGETIVVEPLQSGYSITSSIAYAGAVRSLPISA